MHSTKPKQLKFMIMCCRCGQVREHGLEDVRVNKCVCVGVTVTLVATPCIMGLNCGIQIASLGQTKKGRFKKQPKGCTSSSVISNLHECFVSKPTRLNMYSNTACNLWAHSLYKDVVFPVYEIHCGGLICTMRIPMQTILYWLGVLKAITVVTRPIA